MKGKNSALQTAWLSMFTNMLLALVKGTAGVVGNSYALIADAIESTADIFSSMLVVLGLNYAKRPADENHPYGHGKIEPLITFAVVAFLVTSATVIAYESIEHIRTPHQTPESWTLYLLAAIILWKEASYQFVMKKSRETNSSSLAADAWHHRSDAITSVMAFLGISIALIGGEGYENADDWAALLASGFILYNSYKIFRPALGEIMDEHRYDDLMEEVRKRTLEVKGVLETDKCYIRKSGVRFHVDLHAIVDGSISVRAGHDIAHAIETHLRTTIPYLGHVLIHIEPEEELEKML